MVSKRALLSAAISALMIVAILATASADTLTGRASIVDGDTIEIHGLRVRVLDVDAPESQQVCLGPDGKKWRCGQEAALALAAWIAARPVECATTKPDRYYRYLARCVVDGHDLATWLAENGLAVPYRECKCEVVREAAARARSNKVGIWAGAFQMPWEWRNQRSLDTEAPHLPNMDPPQTEALPNPQNSQNAARCPIKGNINSNGEHIYHMPGSKWYEATNINESEG